MANIRDTKADVFGRISSFKTLIDRYPKLNDSNSFSSINSSNNQLEFIVDLFTALGSSDSLQNAITRILIDKLDIIEQKVKEGLKMSLKSNICCHLNPSLWKDLKVDIEVKEFDFLSMFQINPRSEAGRSCYFDCGTGESSRDMNVFLYHVIASGNQGTGINWFKYNNTMDQYTKHLIPESISTFQFSENYTDGATDINYSNVMSMTVGGGYTKLNDWTSDYIDSVKFWDKQSFIIELMGKVFGAFGGMNLSPEQIVMRKQIETILDRLSSCVTTSTSETDDSYFSFDNDSYSLMLEEAEVTKVGNYEYDKTAGTAVRISLADITGAFNGLDQKESFEEQKQVFTTGMNSIMDKMAEGNPDVHESDKEQFKKNTLKNLLNELSIAFSMQILSPKILFVILTNMRLMGIDKKYDALTFIRENLNIVSDMTGMLKDAILKELTDEIKEMVKQLAADFTKQIVKDNFIKFRKTLTSLLPRTNYSV